MPRHRLAPRNVVPLQLPACASGMQATRERAACQQKAAQNCTGKVCDDPASEVSNHLTARGGEIDAA
jgi:hypothetical protein